MTLHAFQKNSGLRWLAITVAALTIVGSYRFVVASVFHDQWLTDTVFFAFAQVFAVCAMVIAAYIRPCLSLMFCLIYIVLVMSEIVVSFSGYSWVGFEQPIFQDEPLTLRLINRDWGFRFVALILASLLLIAFCRKEQ